MSSHAKNAKAFIKDEERTNWHDGSIWKVRENRDKATHGIPEWEQLREIASQIKLNALSKLDEYLIQFEKNATDNGVKVHWAATPEEHNQIIHQILAEKNVSKAVKSKSMLTEECGLNEYLEERNIEVIDTDLGERIIQLRGERPSHIITPAIHIKKEEVGELFHEKLNTKKGVSDPTYLTREARKHLRGAFLKAQAGLTGVNFAVAETGGIVVCTNEGNADMGVHLAPIQIHSMGIEKIIPRTKDLGVFTRILARSATGQPVTVYTSHYHRPKPNSEMHVVILDNGRSKHLAKENFSSALKCIRCGACMNSCPIYRRSGGYSYRYTIPGPIGSILAPGTDLKANSDLPFASTLCGSCTDVCPVRINIHEQLYLWRQEVGKQGYIPKVKQAQMKWAGKTLGNKAKYDRMSKVLRWVFRITPKFIINSRLHEWGKQRDLPDLPTQNFKSWYAKNRKNES